MKKYLLCSVYFFLILHHMQHYDADIDEIMQFLFNALALQSLVLVLGIREAEADEEAG